MIFGILIIFCGKICNSSRILQEKMNEGLQHGVFGCDSDDYSLKNNGMDQSVM